MSEPIDLKPKAPRLCLFRKFSFRFGHSDICCIQRRKEKYTGRYCDAGLRIR